VYTLGGGGARAEHKTSPEEEARILVSDALWSRLIVLPTASNSTQTPKATATADSTTQPIASPNPST
jgi:hypothetical protein